MVGRGAVGQADSDRNATIEIYPSGDLDYQTAEMEALDAYLGEKKAQAKSAISRSKLIVDLLSDAKPASDALKWLSEDYSSKSK